MNLKVQDIIATTYLLLDNIDDDEVDFPVVLELLGSILSVKMYQSVFGNLDSVIRKEKVIFSNEDTVDNLLPDFGDVVYLDFNGSHIDESTVSQLQIFKDSGILRAAFWRDSSDNSNKISLSMPATGILNVWYEPYIEQNLDLLGDTTIPTSLKWCIATQLAVAVLPYVKYKSEFKLANKPALAASLGEQAAHWEKIYLEKVNRIGTAKPYVRLPFIAK